MPQKTYKVWGIHNRLGKDGETKLTRYYEREYTAYSASAAAECWCESAFDGKDGDTVHVVVEDEAGKRQAFYVTLRMEVEYEVDEDDGEEGKAALAVEKAGP